MSDVVRIFDTTLRDGEQSPGATLDSHDKLEIAHQLARLGVDIMEAGFPAASPGDWEAVHRIAEHVGNPAGPVIAGLARATRKDIDAAWSAVQPAARPRIHTFIATSDVHLEHKLRMSRAEVLERTAEMVAYARSLCADIEFSPEDGTRSDPEYLCEVLAAAVAAGATTLNIPDTVGYTTPIEMAALIRKIRATVPGIDKCIISVHCHDDLGLATANTLAALEAGARQAEVTINGIGERAGNASLEEVVMALRTREARYGLTTNIETTQITRTSNLVAFRTGLSVAANKAVVGANAFAHEAGIHQDGVLKNELTYEIMRPETVGLAQNRLVLGKHSGRHAFRKRMEELGYTDLNEEQVNQAFARFKALADSKKTVTEADLEVIVADEVCQPPETYVLHGVHVSCGSPAIPTASVTIGIAEGPFRTGTATGNGPVDAIFGAINNLVPFDAALEEYVVHAVSGGVNALGEVTVRIRPCAATANGRSFSGHGADTDILVASARAYVSALNKLASVVGVPAGEAAFAVAVDAAEEVSAA